MNIETIKNTFPDFAKDIKLNRDNGTHNLPSVYSSPVRSHFCEFAHGNEN